MVPVFSLGLYYGWQYYSALYKCTNLSELGKWETQHELYPLDLITAFSYSLQAPRLASQDIQSAIRVSQAAGQEVFLTENGETEIILVLGESYIKRHASLYGYHLNTTPQLQAEEENGNLYVFNNVVTPYNGTTLVQRAVFSCNSISNGEDWFEKPIFPVVFKNAGYQVFFWDNQKNFDTTALYTFTINSFLYNKDIARLAYTEVNNKTFTYDQDLIKDFFSAHPGNQKSLVIFHLLGQHFEAQKRYPHDRYDKFGVKDITRTESYLTEEKKKEIAEYDNATYYNDVVMGSIFSQYRKQNAVVVYFPDHGEEIYDFRDMKGRTGDMSIDKIHYQYEIPFMIWCSDKYKMVNPDVVERIKASVDKPFMIDKICHVLFDLGKIETRYYDASQNILSPYYRQGIRIVDNTIDYDKSMKKGRIQYVQ